MNVATIECDQTVAAQKYRDYLTATERTPADEQCKRIYRAIANGKRIINLCEAMRLAGTDHRYRPRLAIARAGRTLDERIDFRWYENRPVFGDPYNARSTYSGFQEGVFTSRVVLPEVTFPRQLEGWRGGHFGEKAAGRFVTSINATVPAIPPNLRPPGTKAHGYHILWEVDEWADGQSAAQQSRDPLLLKHLGSWFFVIVAEWNLTSIERQVLDLSMTR